MSKKSPPAAAKKTAPDATAKLSVVPQSGEVVRLGGWVARANLHYTNVHGVEHCHALPGAVVSDASSDDITAWLKVKAIKPQLVRAKGTSPTEVKSLNAAALAALDDPSDAQLDTETQPELEDATDDDEENEADL